MSSPAVELSSVSDAPANMETQAKDALATTDSGVSTALDVVELGAEKAGQVQAAADLVKLEGVSNAAEQVGDALSNEQFAAAREIADTGVVQEIAGDVTELVLAPVAGPFFCRLLFLLGVVCAMSYFGFLVAQSGPGWRDKLAFTDFDYVIEQEYPDVFACIPADYVKDFYPPLETGQLFLSGGPGSFQVDPQGTGRCNPQNGSAQLVKFDPIGMGDRFGGMVPPTAARFDNDVDPACPTKLPTVSDTSASSIYIGCIPDGSSPAECATTDNGMPNGEPLDEPRMQRYTGALDPVAAQLVDLLPISNSTNTVQKAVCLRWQMKQGAKQTLDENGKYAVGFHMDVKGTLSSGDPFFVLYLTPPGTTPYSCASGTCRINATSVYMSGPPTIQMVFLGKTVTDDQTDADPNKHVHYPYHTWSKIASTETSVLGGGATVDIQNGAATGAISGSTLLKHIDTSSSVLAFKFDDFTVQTVTIRYHTYSEIFAALGGLWAGSLAILYLFFKKSGHLNRKGGREMYIFNFVLPSMRKQYLAMGVKKDDTEGEGNI